MVWLWLFLYISMVSVLVIIGRFFGVWVMVMLLNLLVMVGVVKWCVSFFCLLVSMLMVKCV